jgi:hypothetical protein
MVVPTCFMMAVMRPTVAARDAAAGAAGSSSFGEAEVAAASPA